jgi:hypothetical protein
MPKVTRKYPTKDKTTTFEGNREYRKLQQRDFRKRKALEISQIKKRLALLEAKEVKTE